jgi:hypothetical protein
VNDSNKSKLHSIQYSEENNLGIAFSHYIHSLDFLFYLLFCMDVELVSHPKEQTQTAGFENRVPKKYTAVRKEVAGGLRNMHNDKF